MMVYFGLSAFHGHIKEVTECPSPKAWLQADLGHQRLGYVS